MSPTRANSLFALLLMAGFCYVDRYFGAAGIAAVVLAHLLSRPLQRSTSYLRHRRPWLAAGILMGSLLIMLCGLVLRSSPTWGFGLLTLLTLLLASVRHDTEVADGVAGA